MRVCARVKRFQRQELVYDSLQAPQTTELMHRHSTYIDRATQQIPGGDASIILSAILSQGRDLPPLFPAHVTGLNRRDDDKAGDKALGKAAKALHGVSRTERKITTIKVGTVD